MMEWKKLLNTSDPRTDHDSTGDRNSEERGKLGLSRFERDYYTIISNSYFRRLQGKTQVYTLDENDLVRNRLTHSMEVSSIAEILGKSIAKRIERIKSMEDISVSTPVFLEELPENIKDELSEEIQNGIKNFLTENINEILPDILKEYLHKVFPEIIWRRMSNDSKNAIWSVLSEELRQALQGVFLSAINDADEIHQISNEERVALEECLRNGLWTNSTENLSDEQKRFLYDNMKQSDESDQDMIERVSREITRSIYEHKRVLYVSRSSSVGLEEDLQRDLQRIYYEKLKNNLPGSDGCFLEDFTDSLSMVMRCVGLLHDIGNPPFGHSGERYIREYFNDNEEKLRRGLTDQKWYDLINFDGNAHNVRIITKLGYSSNPEIDKFGMNLSNAIIGGIIKYPYNSLRNGDSNSSREMKGKIGFYHSEEWIVKTIMKQTGTEKRSDDLVGYRNPIMLIMEAADDIAYATADVEDTIKKGEEVQNDKKNKLKDIYEIDLNVEDELIQKKMKEIRERAMEDVVETFMSHYYEIMTGEYEGELFSDQICNIQGLKGIMSEIFRRRDEISEIRFGAKEKITKLLDILVQALTKDTRERTIVEEWLVEDMDQYVKKTETEAKNSINHTGLAGDDEEAEKLYYKYLAVIDYVSAMTDNYVLSYLEKAYDQEYIQHRKLKYKNECIDKIVTVPKYNGYTDANIALSKISCVNPDEWTDFELSEILRNFLGNDQIHGVCSSATTDANKIQQMEGLIENWRERRHNRPYIDKYISEDEVYRIRSFLCNIPN